MATFFGPTEFVVGPIEADPRDSKGPLSTRLFSKMRPRERGINVYILTDNTVTQDRPVPTYHADGTPNQTDEDQIKHTLWGGHVEPITDAEVTLLTAAGYAAYIQP